MGGGVPCTVHDQVDAGFGWAGLGGRGGGVVPGSYTIGALVTVTLQKMGPES